MEAVLMFDDKDFEAHTGVDAVEGEADTDASPGETQPSDDGAVSKQSDQDTKLLDQQIEQNKFALQTQEEAFETNMLKVDEEWRDIYSEARFYPDELSQEIFEPI